MLPGFDEGDHAETSASWPLHLQQPRVCQMKKLNYNSIPRLNESILEICTSIVLIWPRLFSQTIFEKLCVTLLSPLASSFVKSSLVGVFANMQADVETTMKVFALGERILQGACSQQLIIALISALTTLAVSCRFAASELVSPTCRMHSCRQRNL